MSESHSHVTIKIAASEDSEAIEAMLHNYLLELGESTDYPYLNLYWREESRFPYLIYVGSEIAGFALVRLNESHVFEIAEFYVQRHFRRAGVGLKAVELLVSRHLGQWEIRSFPGNHVAEIFWMDVVKTYAPNAIQSMSEDALVFKFKTLTHET